MVEKQRQLFKDVPFKLVLLTVVKQVTVTGCDLDALAQDEDAEGCVQTLVIPRRESVERCMMGIEFLSNFK